MPIIQESEYERLKTRIEELVGNDPDYSLDALAHESEWWLDVIKRRHEQEAQLGRIRRVELIWSYWMEEGGLVQAINAICRRFQNKDGMGVNPLAHMDISPLYPVADLLWGYIEDEKNRVSLRRRAHEYDHQYGLNLVGRAVGTTQPADMRSRFLESFHSLLSTTFAFYKQLDDLNVAEDGRPVLNSLKELQRVLSEGAYNQYAALPVKVRVDMLIIQDILNRKELHEFLGSRLMQNYPQNWMAHLDTMWRLMGWGSEQVTDFLNLAESGERLLLSVRVGPFGPTEKDGDKARTWAKMFRDHVTQYVCSYRAVTGVDLSAPAQMGQRVDATQPSVYLSERERAAQRVSFRQPRL